MTYHVEVDRETDGRWIAVVLELPGVLAYGADRQEAVARAQALALCVLADGIERHQRDELVVFTFVVS